MAANVPSACQRCSQRCVALFEAHWGPRGTSHHRHPVIKTYNNVFKIFRTLDGELITVPTATDFRNLFEKYRAILLVTGEGGIGKTSFACKLAS